MAKSLELIIPNAVELKIFDDLSEFIDNRLITLLFVRTCAYIKGVHRSTLRNNIANAINSSIEEEQSRVILDNVNKVILELR